MDTYNYMDSETLAKEYFSDDVIALCAINATLRAKGVIGFTGGITDSLSETILGKETLSKGVKVSRKDDNLEIDVYVVVAYGTHIPQLAWEIQENVKEEIKEMTDLDVKSVNIHVQRVK